MNDKLLKIIDIFYDMCKKEDEYLYKLFLKKETYNNYNSYGIDILPESFYVYLFFKTCLNTDIFERIAWEDSYLYNTYKKADIAIYKGEKKEAIIEFKIWYNNYKTKKKIDNDLFKLSNEINVSNKYMIIINVDKNSETFIEYLNHKSNIEILYNNNFSTDIYQIKKGQRIKGKCFIYLLEILN